MAMYAPLARLEPPSPAPPAGDEGSPDKTSPAPKDESARTKEKGPWDSLGATVVLILAAGTVSMVIALAFLAVLWRGATLAANQLDPGGLWQSIVLNDWAARTVTICAAVIRIAISVQIGSIMSMVASLLLERYPVELPDVALFTIARALNIQPISLLFFKGRALSRSSKLCICIVMTAGVIVGLSTFTSTILLSDFGRIHTVRGSNIASIRDGIDMTGSSLDLWRSSFVQYPRFAECTTDNEPPLTGPHLDDTGRTLRALLPFQTSAKRSTLRSYTGPAPLFDTRFICFPPNLTLISFNSTLDPNGRASVARVAVSGEVTFDGDHDVFRAHGSATRPLSPFHCVLPYDSSQPGLSRNISICALPALGLQYALTSTSTYQSSGPYLPFTYLVFKATEPDGGWWPVDTFFGGNDTISSGNTTMTQEGPWLAASFVADGVFKGLRLSITACITASRGGQDYITATSQEDGPEPTLAWALPATGHLEDAPVGGGGLYDTEAVRRLLDVTSTKLSPAERGIMTFAGNFTNVGLGTHTIAGTDVWDFLPQFNVMAIDHHSGETWATNHSSNPTALMVFGSNQPHQTRSVGHPSHISLFCDSLEATLSPAKALQAMYTTLIQQQYYDSLPRLHGLTNVTYVYSVEVLAPSRWAGFIVVAVMLAVHLLLVASTTVWFMCRVRHTMLGNSWQAVAQLSSEATAPLLLQATDLNDGDVKDIIRRGAGSRQRYGIVWSPATGRRELAPVA